MNKKKYSVYCSKSVYGAMVPFRLFYVFVNDEGSEHDKSLIHRVVCNNDDKLCVGDSCFGNNQPPPWFMKSLWYCGGVDDLYEINFRVDLM